MFMCAYVKSYLYAKRLFVLKQYQKLQACRLSSAYLKAGSYAINQSIENSKGEIWRHATIVRQWLKICNSMNEYTIVS